MLLSKTTSRLLLFFNNYLRYYRSLGLKLLLLVLLLLLLKLYTGYNIKKIKIHNKNTSEKIKHRNEVSKEYSRPDKTNKADASKDVTMPREEHRQRRPHTVRQRSRASHPQCVYQS